MTPTTISISTSSTFSLERTPMSSPWYETHHCYWSCKKSQSCQTIYCPDQVDPGLNISIQMAVLLGRLSKRQMTTPNKLKWSRSTPSWICNSPLLAGGWFNSNKVLGLDSQPLCLPKWKNPLLLRIQLKGMENVPIEFLSSSKLEKEKFVELLHNKFEISACILNILLREIKTSL